MYRHVVTIALFLGVLTLPAWSQNADEATCAGTAGPVPKEQQSAACDRLVADTSRRVSRQATAHVLRARLRRLNGDGEGALADYDAAVTLDPDSFDAVLGRGLVKVEAHKDDEALTDLNRALKLNPSTDLVYLLRSGAYLSLHRYSEAIADADHNVHSNEWVPGFLNQRCSTRAIAGIELDKARTACDLVLKMYPNNSDTLINRGLVGLKQQLFQAAWDDYNAAVKITPRSPWAVYGRGIAALRLGRADEGKADLATAQSIRSNIAAAFADEGITP